MLHEGAHDEAVKYSFKQWNYDENVKIQQKMFYNINTVTTPVKFLGYFHYGYF